MKLQEAETRIKALIEENKKRWKIPEGRYNAQGNWGYYIGMLGRKSKITGLSVWNLKAGQTGYWNMLERCNKQNLCLLASEDKPYYYEGTLITIGKSLYGEIEDGIRWAGYTEMFGNFKTMKECEAAGWALADIFEMEKKYVKAT